MFGMIILNHMNMFGNNISVKLRLFDKKIEEVDKIRFILNDDVDNAIEVDNNYGDDEFSSQFVNFIDLKINTKYKINAEYYAGDEWILCAESFTSTLTHSSSNKNLAYRTFMDESLPIASLNTNNYEIPIIKPSVLSVSYEVIK